ncbi:EAL domain-containing protein [Halopseudomonas sp.]|uniref:EAL domain-containing protein n=1 Tax=Halopseudomonas sp. TaxID=2901191 RepID=UPI003001A6EA
MAIDIRTFHSPIARRLFLFFFLAVTFPALLLVSVTFFQLTGYMADQHKKELQQDAKFIGLNIFERLQRIGDELPRLAQAQNRSNSPGDSTYLANSGAVAQLVSAGAAGGPVWLFSDDVKRVFPDSFLQTLRLAPGTYKAGVMRLHQVRFDGKQGIFVSLGLASGEYLIARLNPDYLWDREQLPHDKSVCILAGSSTVLFCSEEPPQGFISAFSAAHGNSSLGVFEWEREAEPMRAVYWEVFLRNLGLEDNWAVVLSQPEQTLFTTSGNFQNTLVIIVLASVLMALMFSIGHLRRVLKPLQTLRDATLQVSQGELHQQVDISSGDEFEELALAFNGMTGTLARQFEQRESLMALDRLILSSKDSMSVVNEVLLRARDFLGCRLLLVAVKEKKQLKVSVVGRGSEIEDSFIASALEPLELAQGELKSLPYVFLAKPPHWLPLIPESLVCGSWLLLPLPISGSPQGFVLVGAWEGDEADEMEATKAVQVIGRLSVVLTRARWQADLYHQAHFDDLTGLPNRAALKANLNGAFARSRTKNTRVALLLIDLDRFKLINDSIGHAAGDLYLQAVAERIRECVGGGCDVFRLGGDEFTVVIADIPAQVNLAREVTSVVNRILEQIPKPVRVGRHDLRSTLSVGASVFPDNGQTIDDLMKQADTAMYQAKHNGGNGFLFFAERMLSASQERMELDNDMRKALENDQFLLYFQPQVDADSKRMLGAEVLLRWNHPVRNWISPGIFIPIAEESLLIAEIDSWVLRAACQQIRRWLDAGIEPVRLAINISAAQFQNPLFVELVAATLASYDLTPDRIELEITEGALIDNLVHAQQVLFELREMGVRLALDDFGTGYCSLGYLKKMPIDKLKIDQSFVRDITLSARDAAIVEVILQLASQLDLFCIAEGVETVAELDWLLDKGCEVFQGYLFHRPMPILEFEELLQARQV